MNSNNTHRINSITNTDNEIINYNANNHNNNNNNNTIVKTLIRLSGVLKIKNQNEKSDRISIKHNTNVSNTNNTNNEAFSFQ